MHIAILAAAFSAHMKCITTLEELYAALEQMCRDLGFRYFALNQHIDFGVGTVKGIRLHNYPSGYEEWVDHKRLGVSDPVHRASHRVLEWFAWSQVPNMIAMTRKDEAVFRHARREGIGEGITVPANLPGEARGSCSFATARGVPLPTDVIPFIQGIGVSAFQCALRLSPPRFGGNARVKMTDRQRDCLMWWSRGNSDKEVAQILGISRATVIDHLHAVQKRLGGLHRRLLMMQAVYDGALCFDDILPIWQNSPHLWG